MTDLDGVGVVEAAEILGVTKQRVHQLARTDAFPKPILRVKAGPIWDRIEVADYAATRRTQSGRPKRADDDACDKLRAEVGRLTAENEELRKVTVWYDDLLGQAIRADIGEQARRSERDAALAEVVRLRATIELARAWLARIEPYPEKNGDHFRELREILARPAGADRQEQP